MEGPATNSQKANEKAVKKNREEKLMEQKIESEIVKKVLNGIEDPNQKIQVLLKRCVESERQLKGSQLTQKQNQKTIADLLHEKDNLSADYSRTIDIKQKLENLCRELQHQNKTIKEDSLAKIKEEEEHRKETQFKFQQSLNEIQKLMNENAEKNKKLEEDNREMSTKFKHVLTQYEEREKQMDKINKQMELVTQLNDAKLAKASVELLAEREGTKKEIAVLEETILILKRQLAESLASERTLRAQVELYSSKYGEFTKTFDGYKTDMTKMTKKTFKMEKEMIQWKIKYEKANAMLLDLISEKQVRDEHITKTAKQLYHLQKLCRTLSAEKKAFYSKLVEMNIEVPEVKEIPNELPENATLVEEPKPQQPDKLDEMVKSRDELKKNLQQLQGQLSDLATAELTNENSNVKKSKNKKNRKGKNVKEDLVAEEETPLKNIEATVETPLENIEATIEAPLENVEKNIEATIENPPESIAVNGNAHNE